MENASFVGLFGVIHPESFPPGPDFSGVCYVWQTPSAQLLVLPLNSRHIPTGECLFMSTREFGEHMQPIDSNATPGLCPSSSILRPDSPDLLGIWYEQAVSGPVNSRLSDKSARQIALDKGLTVELPRAPVSRDEALFTPLWHPDELLQALEDTQNSPASVAQEADDPFARFAVNIGPVHANYAGGVENLPPSGQMTPPQGGAELLSLSAPQNAGATSPEPAGQPLPFAPEASAAAASSPVQPLASYGPGTAQQPARQKEESAETEERNAKLEQVMRTKFAALLSQMDDEASSAPSSSPSVPSPPSGPSAADTEMEKLLTLGSAFTWKQKFMFTEFGLALRRKHKYTLALTCHLRALALSSQDEHILFNVARSEYELGNIEKAGQYLDRALMVSPGFDLARNFKIFLAGHAQA